MVYAGRFKYVMDDRKNGPIWRAFFSLFATLRFLCDFSSTTYLLCLLFLSHLLLLT